MKTMSIVSVTVGMALSSYAYDSSTVAFYPFADAKPGEFSATLANAVEGSSVGAGEAVAGSDSSKTVLTADGPGAYIFQGEELLFKHPLALKLGSGECTDANKSGTLKFSSAAKALAGDRSSGTTIEFFFKMDPSDGSRFWNYQVYADLGYKYKEDGVFHPVRVTIPYPSVYYRFRASYWGYDGGPFPGTTVEVQKQINGFTVFNDGKWHHYAQVETAGASGCTLNFYIDHVCVQTIEMGDAVTAEKNNNSVFNLGNQSWNAAISCVRFSNRARPVSEFLRARNGIYSSDVIAFYPFADGAVGESCVGTKVINNDVDRYVCPGTVELSTTVAANPSAVYDDDCPGPYIYAGKRQPNKEPIFETPGSLHFTSDQTGKSAQLKFMEMASVLAQLHSTGSTVEFFIKFDDANLSVWDPCVRYDPGYFVSDAQKEFRGYFPYGSNKSKVALSLGVIDYAEPPYRSIENLPADPLTDGKWHHVGIVETPQANQSAEISVWFDRVKCGSITADSVADAAVDQQLYLCMFSNHARYSCFKVTKGALEVDEFMYAYKTKLPPGLMLIVR